MRQIFFGLCLCVMTSSAFAAEAPRDETFQALANEFEVLSKGGSRKESLKNLQEVAKPQIDSPWRVELLKAICDLEKAIAEETAPIHPAEDEIRRLVTALRDATPDGTFVNGTLVRGHFLSMPGPARDLFLKGEKAVPCLIDVLDDDTMTRFYQHCYLPGDGPEMLRRSDIALSILEEMFHLQLIEQYQGISKPKTDAYWHIVPNCRMSRLDLKERCDIINRIRQWWEETADQPIEQKMIWQIRHAAGFSSKRLAIQNLEALGLGAAKTLSILQTLYREQRAQGTIDVELASFMAKSGDLTPLDDMFHEAVNLSRNNLSILRHLEYLTRYGGKRESSFLRRHFRKTPLSHERVRAVHIWADALTPGAIPLLFDYLIDGSPGGYIDTALTSLQKIAEVDFGFTPTMSAEQKNEVLARAWAWWRSTHFEIPWKAEWERLPQKERATIEQWAASLGDPSFELREKAARELKSLGSKAAWICLVHSRENPDLEIRQRAEKIIEDLMREE